MNLTQKQVEFIISWGSLGSKWGINKTLAQIHALFIISNESICTEDIMEGLQMSRGNVNMNVRTLIKWGLVYRVNKLGERKDFFVGEKDMWLIFKRVLKVRKEKELDPMLKVLQSFINTEEENEKDIIFQKRIKDIEKFASEADKMMEKFTNQDENWFWSTLMKLIYTK